MTTAAYCFKIESCEENLYCFFPQRWTERGCCSSPLVERHHCNLAYQFEESLIYQLYTMAKEMHMVQMLLFSLFATQCHHERTKRRDDIAQDLILPSFCQQRTTCICWLEKLNTSLLSKDGRRLFVCKIPKHVIDWTTIISLLNNCVMSL